MNILRTLLPSAPVPELDPLSVAGHTIDELSNPLAHLAESTDEDLEVIPSEHEAYVFIGSPPNNFELAWVHHDTVSHLHKLSRKHGLSEAENSEIMEQLRRCYRHHQRDYRFHADVDHHDMMVLPSNSMQLDLHDIIDKVLHHH